MIAGGCVLTWVRHRSIPVRLLTANTYAPWPGPLESPSTSSLP